MIVLYILRTEKKKCINGRFSPGISAICKNNENLTYIWCEKLLISQLTLDLEEKMHKNNFTASRTTLLCSIREKVCISLSVSLSFI